LEVTITPNPFARGQPVEIEYSVPPQTVLSARIYDVNGREIVTFLDQQPAASGTITWEGLDQTGQHVPPGVYVLLLQTEHGATKKIVLAVSPAE
jgi:flagellar hook assembly protein FlgD